MTLMTSSQKLLRRPQEQYLSNEAPNGSFGTFTAPSIVTNANGSVDLVLEFVFNQSTLPASNFLIFYNATGAASALTDAAHSIDARSGDQTYIVRILGINPTTHYSYAVAAYVVTKSGRILTSLQTPASWQNFQPASAANYTGNINSIAASTVTANAANGQTAYTDTTQYRGDTAPNGTFSDFVAPSIITNVNGSVDLVLQFQYAQGTQYASNFLVFYNAAGAASQITDAAYSIDARSGTATYTIRILGINPTYYYSYAVAAYTVTKSGRAVTSLATVSSWQTFQPATAANYTGNIDGTVASTVKSGAANGQTAFTDTSQFRGDLPPSNAPTTTGSDISASQAQNGSYVITLNWNYTQGSNIATHFAVFVKPEGGTISISDPHFLVGANLTTIKLPMQLSTGALYSFAIAAVAVTKSGSTFKSTLLSMLNSTLLDTVLQIGGAKGIIFDTAAGYYTYFYKKTHFQDTTYIRGDYIGILDLNTYSGVFKPRIVVTAANPPSAPSMASGEWIVFLCTGINCAFFVYYDGTDRYYLGGLIGTSYAAYWGKNIY